MKNLTASRRGTAEVIFRGVGIHRGGFGCGTADNREKGVDSKRVNRLRALSNRAAEFHSDTLRIQPLQEPGSSRGRFTPRGLGVKPPLSRDKEIGV